MLREVPLASHSPSPLVRCLLIWRLLFPAPLGAVSLMPKYQNIPKCQNAKMLPRCQNAKMPQNATKCHTKCHKNATKYKNTKMQISRKENYINIWNIINVWNKVNSTTKTTNTKYNWITGKDFLFNAELSNANLMFTPGCLPAKFLLMIFLL